MLKLLIVDDEYDKIQAITSAIIEAGIAQKNIKQVTSAQAARQALHTTDFDFLIIDLQIPDVTGGGLSDTGGIALFDMICLDRQIRLPQDVVFISAREELIGDVENKVTERGAQLLKYRVDCEHWKKVLIGRLNYVLHCKQRGQGSRADVVIVTALNSPELEAVLRLPYQWTQTRFPKDPTLYHSGQISRSGDNLTVVAAHAQRKGMPSSAALAARMALLFRPRYLVMTGICAGITGKVNLGDIVIGSPTWDWGSGKSSQDMNGSSVFHSAPYQHPIDPFICQLAEEIGKDGKVIQGIYDGWPAKKPSTMLRAHVGPMASGAMVIADETTSVDVAAQHREVVAIEMEAYAVMAAADYSADPRPIALAIKSICDFANPEKNDDWQSYAAYTSAAFMDLLLRNPNLRFD